MREQVIPQKVGNRTGLGKSRSGVGQRPAKRAPAESIGARLRSLLGYIPTALRIAVIAIVCLLVVVVYRAAASASFFQIKNPELWSRLRTTNLIERAFREVRRRTRPMGVMAHTQSLQRIVFAVFHHLNENWRQQPLKFPH